ncbi:MAG: UDP-3-O-(3-hydroxymyristoyl)glucosamine N-acyltransferase [Deltaproteobacteria bacterium]|nr:MAG: UDP-3-O-(3-hydroxymyristoyl)glucosamine N-acyltransferase [Deltaproteobacteria bacterium]
MELSLDRIAEVVNGEIKGDKNKNICGAAPFDDAKNDEITFAGEAKFLKKIDATEAGAIIVPRAFQASTKNILRVNNPQLAFAMVLNLFYSPLKPEPGISPQAYIGKNFLYGQEVSIAPFVVIGNNVTFGHCVVLHPNVVIGDNVIIGNDVQIHPNVTILDRCTIGNRVIIHAGTVIGSDGFGFAPDGKKYYKIPHTGIVRIDDDVEIGAGNTIDRATFGKTWIKNGVKTDNLVHIAHNVSVGENSVLVAQVGISGSVTIGKNVILAGQAGVVGHLNIGDNVTIGAQAGVAKSVSGDEIMSGSPAIPHRLWLRIQKILPRLPKLKKKLEDMEKRLKKIERTERENGENF